MMPTRPDRETRPDSAVVQAPVGLTPCPTSCSAGQERLATDKLRAWFFAPRLTDRGDPVEYFDGWQTHRWPAIASTRQHQQSAAASVSTAPGPVGVLIVVVVNPVLLARGYYS